MIVTTLVETCHHCGSRSLTCNGHTPSGKQKYECTTCHHYGTLHPTQRYSESQKEQILLATQERTSFRGIERIFGVSRHTVAAWLKKKANSFPR